MSKINILKEIIENEVYPAFGCTEPISVAYACSYASSLIPNKNLEELHTKITLDPATYKNGYAVFIPSKINYGGNLTAAAIGTIKANPTLKNKIFEKLSDKELKNAEYLLKNHRIELNVDYTKKDIYIEATIKTKKNNATCIITKGHFNVSLLSLNGDIIKKQSEFKDKTHDYREILKNLNLEEILKIANTPPSSIISYIEKGINMNLKASKEGLKLKKTSYHLNQINKKFISKNLITKIQEICTAATDARMNGMPIPVMSSGQSGNQGVVAILVPYLIGKEFKIKKEKILKSIILSHLINAYIKAYTGELSTMCGCSLSSGAAASAAIVYMFSQEPSKILNAINNVIADIGGIICDGAKESCSLKVATSVETSIRAAFLAINGYTTNPLNGFLGNNLKETIQNTARMSISGMSHVDATTIEIMKEKLNRNV